MSTPPVKIFSAPEDKIPPHVKRKNLEQATKAGIPLQVYDARVLYALSGDLSDDKKAQRSL